MGVGGVIGKTGWSWAGIYPMANVTALLSGTFWTAAVVVVALVLIFGIIAVINARGLAEPLGVMTSKMTLINNGNFDERFSEYTLVEYNRISENFNMLIKDVTASEEIHRTVSNISDNILFEWSVRNEKMYVTDNFSGLFRLNTEEATLTNGLFLDSLMEPTMADNWKVDVAKLLKQHDENVSEYQVKSRTGKLVWIRVTTHCVMRRQDDTQISRIIGVIANIDSEKTLAIHLANRASYDFLSGLFNRSTFLRELGDFLALSDTAPLALIFIDVDDFKFINDRYGHSVGDEIIKHVALVVKDTLKDNGFAGRFGGDEFMICVNRPVAVSRIEEFAGKLIEIFNKGYHSDEANVTLAIKASLGVSFSPQHGRDVTELVSKADEAMYFVKKNGKSNYHIYQPKVNTVAEEEDTFE
ncbi:hypothetical protein FACS189499_10350 [Clostridia bacterium]|nr:hypothetical protein FACS189499_10350 [Clostridia bacterium]